MSSAVTLAGGVSFKECAKPSRGWRHKTQSSSVGRLTPDKPYRTSGIADRHLGDFGANRTSFGRILRKAAQRAASLYGQLRISLGPVRSMVEVAGSGEAGRGG